MKWPISKTPSHLLLNTERRGAIPRRARYDDNCCPTALESFLQVADRKAYRDVQPEVAVFRQSASE
jgi:hypothetical protein